MSRAKPFFLLFLATTQSSFVVVRMKACAESSLEGATSRIRCVSFGSTGYVNQCSAWAATSNRCRDLGLHSSSTCRGGCDSGSADPCGCMDGLLARLVNRLDRLGFLCNASHKILCDCGSFKELEGSLGMNPEILFPHILKTGFKCFGRMV